MSERTLEQEMRIRNVLSTFNGMSCGNIALDKAGIEFDNYYSSEVDKYAIQVTQANYPNTIQLGDVTKWREWNIDWSTIDLFIGGSPCQGFSFAGKQLAFDDPRSKLFFVFVDILNHIKRFNPNVKFMLENVRMKEGFRNVITGYLDVSPVRANSALVSAQNRIRDYWCNWDFWQPKDKDLVLVDILESEVDEKFYYGEKSIAYMQRGNEKWMQAGKRRADRYTMSGSRKSFCLTANFHKGVPYNYLECPSGLRKLTPIECERLQTVPDNYTNHVSNSQRYKMLGNGWTVDVIAHIFSTMDQVTEKRETDCIIDQLEFNFPN